jgi:glycerophosphoryl diester phosphodiesterase
MDVVVSADGQVVVSHEPWLNPQICLDPNGQPIPITDGPLFNLYQLPYATIARCDCGSLQHPGFAGQVPKPAHKPLLREVLSRVEASSQKLGRPSVGYSIEIKSSPEGDGVFHPQPAVFLDLVVAELAAAQVLARTTILSFDARILQLTHQQYPDLATSLLLEEGSGWLPQIQALGFEPTVLGPDFRAVTPATVRELRTIFPSIQLVPWTVNTAADMSRMILLKPDGITTDYPDRLLRRLCVQ